MKNAIIIVLTFLLLVGTAYAQDVDQPGCCCNVDGDAQKGSIQLFEDCDQDAGFAFRTPDDPNFFLGREAATVCDEFCDTQKGLELIQVDRRCGDPNFKPAPSNLIVSPIKGEANLRLQWDQQCVDFVNNFVISRCEGNDCDDFNIIAQIGRQTIFEDPNFLEFATDYTYEVRTEFEFGEADDVVTGVGNPGDIECFEQKSFDNFCVFASYYERFKPIFQELGYLNRDKNDFEDAAFASTINDLFFNNFNKAFRCDNLNKLIETNACQGDTLCFVSNDEPGCAERENCKELDGKPFGLTFDVESCEGSIIDRNFCFFDKSFSLSDMCFDCQTDMSCGDYRSEGACERNNCGVGSCQWREVYPDLDVGVCVDKNFPNCDLCTFKGTLGMQNLDGFNNLFDICTRKRSDTLGKADETCFFNVADFSAFSCESASCEQFNQQQCGSPAGGIQLGDDNSVVTGSNDVCGLGVCQFDRVVGCAKNADAQNNVGADFRDCAVFTDGEERDACEKDLIPPETQIIPKKGTTGVTDILEIRVFDKVSANDGGKFLEEDERSTFFCTHLEGEGACTEFVEVSSKEIVVDNLVLQARDGNEVNIIDTLQEGTNIIRFFSKDSNQNIELVKEQNFVVCSSCQGPKILNITILDDQGREADFLEEAFITNAEAPRIIVIFNKEVTITQNEVQGLTETVGTSINSINANTFEFSPLRDLPEGNYVFKLNAQDELGTAMEEGESIPFIVDTTGPRLTILVNDNSSRGTTSFDENVDIELNFSESAILESVLVVGRNFSKFTNNPIVINITNAFSSSKEDTVFTANLPLLEGENVLRVIARDKAQNLVLDNFNFRVFTEPILIRLVDPSFGVSSELNFDLLVETSNPATCRLWFVSEIPLIPPPAQFKDFEAFDNTGFVLHTKAGRSINAVDAEKVFPLEVQCKDRFGDIISESFEISVDTTPPEIISAIANPNPIVQFPFETTLKVQTNEDTFCRFSKVTTEFLDMEFNFPGFEEEGLSTHSILVNESEITTHVYNILCKNLAGLASNVATITVEMDPNAPFEITSNTPTFFQSTDVKLAVETNKNAVCFASKTRERAGDRMTGEGVSTTHTLEVTEEEGTHTYIVTCATSGESVINGSLERGTIEITFAIDSTPPSMLDVDDSSNIFNNPEISFFTDKLRGKWSGEDQESGITSYLVSVRKEDGTVIVTEEPSQADNEFTFIRADLEDNTKYFFDVKAKNGVGLTSNVLSSDGVTVDFRSLPGHCLNGIRDSGETDIDCGGECFSCKEGQSCTENIDCDSEFCEGSVCKEPTCNDGVQNGRESAIDCGGPCKPCDIGKPCLVRRDCSTNFCDTSGVCLVPPPCFNLFLDGTETDVDCGGACPTTCSPGKQCLFDTDCTAGLTCFKDPRTNVRTCRSEAEIVTLRKELDVDGDGILDSYEEKYGIDNPNSDPDIDTLTNLEEFNYFRDTLREISPIEFDTDGDGWSDFDEIRLGFNPIDIDDHPTSRLFISVIIFGILLLLGLLGYYSFELYKEYQKKKPTEKRIFRKKKVEKKKITTVEERTRKIKEMLTPEMPEYISVKDIQKKHHLEEAREEKKTKQIFSQLSAVRSGKPIPGISLKGKAMAQLAKIKKAFPKKKKEDIPEEIMNLRDMISGRLSTEKRQEIMNKMKRMHEGKMSPEEREKLLKDLKITSSYYKKHKSELDEEMKAVLKKEKKDEK